MNGIGEATTRARSVLAIGGARSGKSAFAQALAERCAKDRVYLATAEPGDAEMAERIARHRADRGRGWTTIEEPLELAATLAREARPGRVVLVDCLTLWLANVTLDGRDVAAEIERLAQAVGGLAGPMILVTNEVGQGVVPESRLGRDFRDWQGRANQALARACDAVAALTAGLPRLLKPAPPFDIELA